MASKIQEFDEIFAKIDEICHKIDGESSQFFKDHYLDFLNQQMALYNSREQFLPRQKFGDIGWAILVELNVARINGLRYSVSDIGRYAEFPLATILRSLQTLQAEHLIVRTPDPEDKRRTFVCITKVGQTILDRIFASLNSAQPRKPVNCNATGSFVGHRQVG